MKINEVEKLIGITKKNIRFYEEQGLLYPSRNRENGYRDYGEDDIKRLEQIKLLRKLGMPIGEIRLMQSGKCTVADSMRRHLVTLEREKANIDCSAELCRSLQDQNTLLADLDSHTLLQRMEELESAGTAFNDIHSYDVKSIRYVGASITSAIMIIFMSGIFFLLLWAYKTDPEDAPPLPLMVILMTVPAIVIVGVLYSLIQRIAEIKKGEIDDAKRF